MHKEKTITISESEFDKIIRELILEHVVHNCKDRLITEFTLDALMIRCKLFSDDQGGII